MYGTIGVLFELLIGILGVQVDSSNEMPRCGAKDLEVARWARRATHVVGGGGTDVLRQGAIDGGMGRERLAGRVERRRGEIEGKEYSSEAWRGNMSEPRAGSVGEHVR